MTTSKYNVHFIKSDSNTTKDSYSYGSVFFVGKNGSFECVLLLCKISSNQSVFVDMMDGSVYGAVISPKNKDFVLLSEINDMLFYPNIEYSQCFELNSDVKYTGSLDLLESKFKFTFEKSFTKDLNKTDNDTKEN